MVSSTGNISTDDKNSFIDDRQGNVARNVTLDSGQPLSAVFSGLSVAWKNTTMNISDTAIKLPATPLTGRNSLSVVNLSEVDTIYIGNSDVTAGRSIGTTSGWEVGPNETLNVDITNDIEIYAIADSGKTVLVKILELA